MPGTQETPLSPVFFLDRAAHVFARRAGIRDGTHEFTYGEFGERAHRLAGLLCRAGIQRGDRVAALCVNSHVLLELHNGVPMAGAVLVPMNIRLSVAEMVHIMENSGARLLIATQELERAGQSVAERTGTRLIVAGGPESEYERLLVAAPAQATASIDEQALISINYTSGSTGRPKGVMCTHRGAYLQALAMAYHSGLGLDSAYLWTLPMFHCNGWCFTWAVTAAGAVHICQREIIPATIWLELCGGGVTHLCAAPTVLTMLAEAATERPERQPPRPIRVFTGGAPPTPPLLARLTSLNLEVTHLYGSTETYGPAVINQWQPEWSSEPDSERAQLNARQGIGNVVTQSVRVVDGEGRDVPADRATLGEIVIRGNNVTPGYYKDVEATRAAHFGEWFRTGDLGVRYPDGYIELRDRAKDIIITGGENVASVEVERALVEHPSVLEAAVVGRADEYWGEVPVAFVSLKAGAQATEGELIDFVRSRIAHFKAPKQIRFEELPKTSTGKIQKHLLRERLTAP